MASSYLSSDDLAFYGITASAADVQQASQIINGFLGRPEGLVWMPDANGAPCYMAGLSPSSSVPLTAPITAGANVVVTLPYTNHDMVGEVLVIDRANPTKTEACVVTSVSGNTVTLANVQRAHVAGILIESGLQILEERSLPHARAVSHLAKTPVVRVLSGQGRYGYGRRSDQMTGFGQDISLISTLIAFGGTAYWIPIDVSQLSVSTNSGELYIPAGIYLAAFTDVRFRYVCGFPQGSIPEAVKQAAVNVILATQNYPEITGNFKKVAAGGSSVERFADTVLDADSRQQLAQYRANIYY